MAIRRDDNKYTRLSLAQYNGQARNGEIVIDLDTYTVWVGDASGALLPVGANSNGTSTFGNAIISGNLSVAGNSVFAGPVNLGDVANLTILGGSANYVLTTDGAGNLSWTPGGGGGNGTYGDSNVELLFNTTGFTGNLIPSANNAFTIGNLTNQWSELYLSGNTIYFDGYPLSAANANVLTYNSEPLLPSNTSLPLTTTANVTANFFIGDGALLANLPLGNGIANGNSNVAIPTAGGNVNVNVGGFSNISVFSIGGQAVTGNISATGNAAITGNVSANIVNANILSAGTGNIGISNNTIYSTNNQITIDPLNDGTFDGNVLILANMTVAGSLTYNSISNATTDNLVWIAANNAATPLLASGGGLAVGPAGAYAQFTYNQASNVWQSSLPLLANGGVNANGALSGATTGAFSGAVTAASFAGDGGNLANIQGANVIGVVANSNYAAYAGNVVVNAQPNITSVGTLTALTVAGLTDLGPNGNVTITGGSSGQVLTTDGSGALSWSTPAAGGLANGTSSVTIPLVDGNVNTSVGGVANVFVVTSTGANLVGLANISGNLAVGGNANIAYDANILGNANVALNLLVAGISNLGPNGNVIITGGANGQVLSTDGSGNLSWVIPGNPEEILNGNSNVIVYPNANVATSVAGNANIFVVTGVGANVAGTLDVTGDTTLVNVAVSGNSNLGDVANITITGGNANYVLTTDGNGVLSWQTTASTFSIVPPLYFTAPATGNNQTFSNPQLAAYSANTDITLFVNGALIENSFYTLAGSTLTFNLPLNAGDAVDIPATGIANANITTAANTIIDGTSNVLVYSSGNVATSVGGSGNIMVVSLQGVNVAGNLSATATTTAFDLLVSNTANLGSNANVTITGGTAGQVLTTDGTGVLSWSTAASGGLANGTSNVAIPLVDGNVNTSVGGVANVLVVTATGANVTGTANVTGNLSVGGNAILGSNANVFITGGTTGQVLTTDGAGNLTWSSGVPSIANTIVDGNSNVLVYANGNIATSVNGTANVLVVSDVDATLAGDFLPAGNNLSNLGSPTQQWNALFLNGNTVYFNGNPLSIASGNANLLSYANNPIIMSNSDQSLTTTANITANNFIGNGALLTNLPLGNGVANGLSNVAIPVANANVIINVAGTAVYTFSDFELNVTTTPPASPSPSLNGFSTADFNVGVTTVDLTANGNASFTGANVSLGAVGNLHVTGGTTGQVLTTDGAGNLSWSSGVPSVSNVIIDGNSNVLVYANGNIATSVSGNANIVVVTGTGANIAGTANITGDILGGANANITANVNAANANISATATAFDLVASNTANLGAVANVTITGGTAGQVLTTDGSNVLSWSTPASGALANGTSNVLIPVVDGNVNTSVAGNANVFVVTGTGANVVGTFDATGNLTAANANIAASTVVFDFTVSNTANLGSNANVIITGGTTGQVLTTDGTGVLTWTSGVPSIANTIVDGNSNVLVYANGNIATSVAGNANIFVVTDVGANVAGTFDVTANLTAANANIAATTALFDLTVANTANLGNVGNVTITGGTANQFLQTDGTGVLNWATPATFAIIPAVYFVAPASGNNQTFTDATLAGYAANTDMTVFYNGALIENTYYTLAGSTLTFNLPIAAGDTIDIPATGVASANLAVYGDANVEALLSGGTLANNIITTGTVTTATMIPTAAVATNTTVTEFSIDNSGTSFSVTTGDTLTFAAFSGMIIVDSFNTGAVGTWLCGGSAVVAVANTGAGAGSIAFTGGNYVWTAVDTGLHTVTTVRTRNGV